MVIELMMTVLTVLECISTLMTLSVRLFALGRVTRILLTLMLTCVVQAGLSVRLVLTNVMILFTVRVLVRTLSESAAPLEDLGLQTLMTWLCGMLLTFKVVLSVREFAGTVLILSLGLLLLHSTTEFRLNPPLTLVPAAVTTLLCLPFAACVRMACMGFEPPVTNSFFSNNSK